MKNVRYLLYGLILVGGTLGVVQPWKDLAQENERLAYGFLNGTLIEEQKSFSVEVEIGGRERVLLENEEAVSFVRMIKALPRGISDTISGQHRNKVAAITVLSGSDRVTLEIFELGSSGVSWCRARNFGLQVFFSVDVVQAILEFLEKRGQANRIDIGSSNKK